MAAPESTVALSLLSVVGTVLCTVGLDVYRRWTDPDRRYLSAFLLVLGTSALGVGVVGVLSPETVLGTAGSGRGWLPFLAWPMTAAAFPWGVFVLRYTGQGDVVLSSRLRTAGVGLVVTCSFAWPTVGRAIGVGWLPSEELTPVIAVAMTVFPFVWFLFVGGGLVALLWTTRRYDYLGPVHRATLGVAPLGPILALVVGLRFGAATPALTVGVIGAGLVLSCGLIALSVYRYGVLETSPAAGNVGRDVVVAGLEELVIVVDDDGQVVDANPAARSTLGVDDDDLPQVTVSSVLGAEFSTLRNQEVIELGTAGGRRRYEARVSTLSGAGGDPIGHAVTLRDVTERAIRDQRLAVLNRVLRHNLRNKLTVARGVADMVVDGEMPPPALAADFEETVEDLLFLGEEACEVEQRMEGATVDHEAIELAPVVESVAETARETFPSATVETDVPSDLGVRADPRLLEYVLRNLVENGIEHNDDDARVVVRAARAPDAPLPVCISVEDDGPGIPDSERQVIESGTETALEHGSGLGLWIAKWGSMRLGGEMRFREVGEGACVELSLPGPSGPGSG